jgi:hypothetical protein
LGRVGAQARDGRGRSGSSLISFRIEPFLLVLRDHKFFDLVIVLEVYRLVDLVPPSQPDLATPRVPARPHELNLLRCERGHRDGLDPVWWVHTP